MTAKVSLGINVIFYFSAIVTVKVTLQAEKKIMLFMLGEKEEMMQREKSVVCFNWKKR